MLTLYARDTPDERHAGVERWVSGTVEAVERFRQALRISLPQTLASLDGLGRVITGYLGSSPCIKSLSGERWKDKCDLCICHKY